VDSHSLAHLKPRLSKESVVDRDERFGNGGGFGPIKIQWNFDERALRRERVFSLRAASRDAEDALPGTQATNLRSCLLDLARELKAGNVLHYSGRRRVKPSSLKNVCTIQTRRVHTHEHTIRRRTNGALDLAHFQTFNIAVRNDNDRAHFLRCHFLNSSDLEYV
jgi:hypothetical protein